MMVDMQKGMAKLLFSIKDHDPYFKETLQVTRYSTPHNCFGIEIAQRIGKTGEMESVATNVKDEVKTELDGVTMTYSNLRCFLDTVTPVVPTYADAKIPYLPSQNNNGEKVVDGVKYFYLADIWNRFYEWSACGVGTSVRLPTGEPIVQYFVPYLSAIELYTKSDVPASQSLGWQSSSNIVQSGTGFDVYDKNIMEDSHVYKTGDERATSMCKGELYLKYFEVDSPYERIPFADKMYELCCKFPKLPSLRSIYLSPTSWLSIYWYPLSHTPARNMKDLSTCFLTYHKLSISEEYMAPHIGHAANYVALAPFGIATHKMDTQLWASPTSGDQKHLSSLMDAAQSWIKKHDIQHHDFNFFSHSNSTYIE